MKSILLSSKRRKDTYWRRHADFVIKCNQLFDIMGSPERIKLHEKLWGVKMTPADHEFYTNQKLVPPIGYCSTFIDRMMILVAY